MRLPGIFRRWVDDFIAGHMLVPEQRKALRAARDCRTPALGGHLLHCEACGEETTMFNSCSNRNCPICQARAQHAWISSRLDRVLPTHHFHVVFTLPADLRPLALRNQVRVYDLMMRSAAEVLCDLAQDRLEAQPGITEVLHTWTREMAFHPHVHCVVTGGGLRVSTGAWKPTSRRFLFPVAVMRRLFRGKVRAGLIALYESGALDLGGSCEALRDAVTFRSLLRGLQRTEWVVYAKPPFAGAQHVYSYLGRYTHRVAISNSRILEVTDDAITFRTRGSAQITLSPMEFLRRFSLHVLPPGFHKIRHFGLYAGTNVKTRLLVARSLFPAEDAAASLAGPVERAPLDQAPEEEAEATVEESRRWLRCPRCGSVHVTVLELAAKPWWSPEVDTS